MEHVDVGARSADPGDPSFANSHLERFCVALCHDLRGPVATAGAAIHRLAHATLAEPDDFSRLLEIARQSLAKADELLTSLPALLAQERAQRMVAVALDDAGRYRAQRRRVRAAPRRRTLRGPRPAAARARRPASGCAIALRNLLRNAIQHRRPACALAITLRAWRRGARWTLTLSDNGSGIPRAEQRARLRAARARRRRDVSAGGGLGLTLARQAIEACGGSIALSSRPGVGASFAITLRGA